MLELIDISYIRDNRKILNNINLKIEGKKFVAITGPNGSGKSTLAKIIMGILKPTSGKIIFMGEDITDLDISQRAKLGIGFAFQQPVKFKGITVKDLIELSLEKGTKCQGSCRYLTDVGLCPKDYMNREINSNLSGGELKRIEIATVVARKCKLTIFDEPEAGIDLWSFSNLIDVFQKMHETIKGSIVIISHQERILNIADEIILLDNGKITQIGSKDIILPKLLNVKSNCKFLKE